jgi:hypothetical protein
MTFPVLFGSRGVVLGRLGPGEELRLAVLHQDAPLEVGVVTVRPVEDPGGAVAVGDEVEHGVVPRGDLPPEDAVALVVVGDVVVEPPDARALLVLAPLEAGGVDVALDADGHVVIHLHAPAHPAAINGDAIPEMFRHYIAPSPQGGRERLRQSMAQPARQNTPSNSTTCSPSREIGNTPSNSNPRSASAAIV